MFRPRFIILIACGWALAACAADAQICPCPASSSSQRTDRQVRIEKSFSKYLEDTEKRISAEILQSHDFFMRDPSTLVAGKPVLEPGGAKGQRLANRDGEVRHWKGVIRVSHVSFPEVLQFFQSYETHFKVYGPGLKRSEKLCSQGDSFCFRYIFRQEFPPFLTLTLLTQHNAVYVNRADLKRAYLSSHTTLVDEIASPSDMAVIANRGYVLQLFSHWRIQQIGDDVYVQCEAASAGEKKTLSQLAQFFRDPYKKNLEEILTKTAKKFSHPGQVKGR
jgi:hypothetical protein